MKAFSGSPYKNRTELKNNFSENNDGPQDEWTRPGPAGVQTAPSRIARGRGEMFKRNTTTKNANSEALRPQQQQQPMQSEAVISKPDEQPRHTPRGVTDAQPISFRPGRGCGRGRAFYFKN